MFNKIKSLLYENVEENTPPTPPNIGNEPLVTKANIKNDIIYQDSNNSGNVFGSTTNTEQPIITEEDKKKYQDYFTDLYSKVKTKSVEYGDFLTNIETVAETDPTLPDVNKFKMAFSFMKKEGVSKDKLLLSANTAVSLIENDREAVFNSDIQSKNSKIESNIKSINEKTEAIQKLTNEIAQLTSDNNTIKEKITKKTLLYNSFFNQLVTKVKNDIIGIGNLL